MRFLTTIIVLCFFANLYCQDKTSDVKPLTFGLNLMETYSQFDGVTLNPGFVIKYSDNSLILSWKVYQSSKDYYRFLDLGNDGKVTDRLGFSIIYKNNLINIKSKLSIDYLLDFSYSNIKGQYNTTYQHDNITVHPAIYSTNQTDLSFLSGFGVGYKVIKNLSIVQSFGIGIGMIKENTQLKLLDQDYTVFDNTTKYSDNLGFSLNVKLGIEYIF